MSTQAIETFLRDILENRSFAAQVRTDPSVLNGYELTPDEKRELRTHDREALLPRGVSPELLAALEVLPLPDETAERGSD
jgi:hypothetical protein